MQYEHHCNTCHLDWLEDYGLNEPSPTTCPECRSEDMYRCVTTSGAFILKGSGWARDGYYHNQALDSHKGRLKLYDRKEDYLREHKGEAAEIARRKLMRQNESIKRTLGFDSQIKEAEAEKKIKKARDKVGSDL